ncbi:kinase-like domain-containing protein, partial [Mycena metata]
MRYFLRGADLRRIRLKFCREALVWKDLHHPHILPFLGIDRDSFPSSLCMVSPWMELGTVVNYLKAHGHANVDRLLYEIAQGLQHLHSNNIVHGDLRGSNILINQDFSACLADFGLSAFSDATSSMSTNRGGSLYWMAPELIDPESFGFKKFARTPATDVYAYGCVCLELYTGRPPFSHLSEPATLIKILSGERPQRPSGPPAMSDALWKNVVGYWAESASTRPATEIVVQKMIWPVPEPYPSPPQTRVVDAAPSLTLLVGDAPSSGESDVLDNEGKSQFDQKAGKLAGIASSDYLGAPKGDEWTGSSVAESEVSLPVNVAGAPLPLPTASPTSLPLLPNPSASPNIADPSLSPPKKNIESTTQPKWWQPRVPNKLTSILPSRFLAGGDDVPSRAATESQPAPRDHHDDNKGETLVSAKRQGHLWHAKEEDGTIGVAPSNYLLIYDVSKPGPAVALSKYRYKAKARYHYRPASDDPRGISFREGEILGILGKRGADWEAIKEDGTTGLAPSSYLLIYDDNDQHTWKPFLPEASNQTSFGSLRPGGSASSVSNSQDFSDNQKCLARATYSYTASADKPERISFQKGEILEILDKDGRWWRAQKADGTIGIAPSNYLWLLQSEISQQPLGQEICRHTGTALTNYTAPPPDTFSFSRGEILGILDFNGDIWQVMKGDGSIGSNIPFSCIEITEESL